MFHHLVYNIKISAISSTCQPAMMCNLLHLLEDKSDGDDDDDDNDRDKNAKTHFRLAIS